ncbi:MAG: hypothetical protein R3E01_26970 [Pirellulaceae bacterium]|nr:hypothetical protein [Planctomycetales bacterium]
MQRSTRSVTHGLFWLIFLLVLVVGIVSRPGDDRGENFAGDDDAIVLRRVVSVSVESPAPSLPCAVAIESDVYSGLPERGGTCWDAEVRHLGRCARDDSCEPANRAAENRLVAPVLPESYRPLGEPMKEAPLRRDGHQIVEGDTLERIAERTLGDARFADEIFQANRDRLLEPDLLPIGVVLRIPQQVGAN